MIRNIPYNPDVDVPAAYDAIVRSQATIRLQAAKINKYKHAIANLGRARYAAAQYRPVPESVRREQYHNKLAHYRRRHAAAVEEDVAAHYALDCALATAQPVTLADLPDEMLLHILQYVKDKRGIRTVCRHLHTCVAIPHMRYYAEYIGVDCADEYMRQLHSPLGFVQFAKLHRPRTIRLYGQCVPDVLAPAINGLDAEILLYTEDPPEVYGLAVANLHIRNPKMLKKIQLSKLRVLTLDSPRQVCDVKYADAFAAEIRFTDMRQRPARYGYSNEEPQVHFHSSVEAELRISKTTHAELLAAGWELALTCKLLD